MGTDDALHRVGPSRPAGAVRDQGPPGNYLALAVEYLEEGQDRDPEFLQQMRPYATSVQLGDAERKVLTLRMIADR
jgi:hypothetical protein